MEINITFLAKMMHLKSMYCGIRSINKIYFWYEGILVFMRLYELYQRKSNFIPIGSNLSTTNRQKETYLDLVLAQMPGLCPITI